MSFIQDRVTAETKRELLIQAGMGFSEAMEISYRIYEIYPDIAPPEFKSPHDRG